MKILALDPAICTGVASGESGPDAVPWLATWVLRENDKAGPEAIFRRAARLLEMRLILEKPEVLAIEMPVPPHRLVGNTQHATTVIEYGLYGLWTGMAGMTGIKVMPVHIRSWRKAVLGKGNLDRASAKRAAAKVCAWRRWDAKDDDQAEAACIFMWACGAAQLAKAGAAAA